ncbi:MAG TPA: diguanylate cyclase, partial [Gammaproteobacteria bacterium]|nr:diguanylate cyclase [Gammaproteobacteria bacterium]
MPKPKILIVDDKVENLITLETVLASLDVEFIQSTNGNDALIHTLNERFSLAILDVQMPNMDGFELARHIRSNPETRQLPIIFLSAAYSDYAHVFKGYESGCIDYLIKPYEPEFLKQKVKLFIELYLHRTRLEQRVEERTAMYRQANETLTQQKNFLEKVFESVRYPFAVINTAHCNISVSNKAANEFFLMEKVGMDTISCEKETCQKQVQGGGINGCFINQVIYSKAPVRKELSESQAGEKEKFYELYAYPIVKGHNNVTQIVVSVFDITERKREERQRQIASQVLESIMEAIVVLDRDGKIQMANPAFTTITGYLVNDAMGKNLDFLKSNIHDEIFYGRIKHALRKTGQWKGEIWLKKKNQQIIPLWLSITPVKGIGNNINAYVAAGQDITRQKQTENEMRHLAHHDSLTGLPNRQLFRDRMEQAIKRAQRNQSKIALLFIDIDDFKNINDSHGHDTGDLFLKEVSQKFSNCIRESDTVYRLGGDEFTIILENISDAEDDVKVVTNKLLDVFTNSFNIDGNAFFLGASIGISIFPDDGSSSDILIKCADTAMYYAKDSGRNNFQFFDQQMEKKLIDTITLENDLRKGLDNREFQVYYQPIIDIKTKTVVSIEA